MCIVVSISCNTAQLFCPFLENGSELKYLKEPTSKRFISIFAYNLFFLFPAAISFLFIIIYSILTSCYTSGLSSNALKHVTQQLHLYPIVTTVSLLPISLYFTIAVTTGIEVNYLGKLSAVMISSNGSMIGSVYLYNITPISMPSWFSQSHSPSSNRSQIHMFSSDVQDANTINTKLLSTALSSDSYMDNSDSIIKF